MFSISFSYLRMFRKEGKGRGKGTVSLWRGPVAFFGWGWDFSTCSRSPFRGPLCEALAQEGVRDFSAGVVL